MRFASPPTATGSSEIHSRRVEHSPGSRRIMWCPGRGEEARRTVREAVDLLEQLPPGRELALAYTSLSFLLVWISNDEEGAWQSAVRALELAERSDDPEPSTAGPCSRSAGANCRGTWAAGWRPSKPPRRSQRNSASRSSSRTPISRAPNRDVGAPLRRRAPRLRGGPRVRPDQGQRAERALPARQSRSPRARPGALVGCCRDGDARHPAESRVDVPADARTLRARTGARAARRSGRSAAARGGSCSRRADGRASAPRPRCRCGGRSRVARGDPRALAIGRQRRSCSQSGSARATTWHASRRGAGVRASKRRRTRSRRDPTRSSIRAPVPVFEGHNQQKRHEQRRDACRAGSFGCHTQNVAATRLKNSSGMSRSWFTR